MVHPEEVTPGLYVRAEDAEPLAPPWSFASLLHPISPEAFCSEYWGERPLHIARGRTDFYAKLITLAEVERYLSMDELFSRHSVTMPQRGYGFPDPPPTSIGHVYQGLLAGSSLRLRRMECFLDPSSPVLALLRGMELGLAHRRDSLSCYVAPPNAIGLGPHHDHTEIFTLQIAGTKRWRIYHRIDTVRSSTHDPEKLAEPTHDFMLEPGDLLYVPRGWVHDVTNKVPAFSLTIVFDPVKWSAVLDLLVAKLAATSPFMAPLPAGVLLGGRRPDSLRQQLEARVALIQDALSNISVDAVIDEAAKKLVPRMTLPPDSQLDALFQLDQMTLETVVEKRPGIACHITRSDDRIVLILPGGETLSASELVEPALRSTIAADGPFRVAEMHASLGAPAKLALAKQLVIGGLLRVL